MFCYLNKISYIKIFREKYSGNSEMYSYEQRQPNNTLNGDRSLSHFVDVSSPFYDRELIEFCLTIPDKYKRGEKIYLDWFNDMHKSISEYAWECAGIKPKNFKLVILSKIFKRYKNGVLRRLGFNINDMNPFDVWLRKNPKIINNLDNEFNKHIVNIKDENLKKLLVDMYKTDIRYSYYGRNNKFLVVTILLALNLNFEDDI
jgi:asparagine synthase (glutamine-hydrolysing)